jgi:uncharacterized protein YabN with tetrapyrrole methylase and pyrophosphatase domain
MKQSPLDQLIALERDVRSYGFDWTDEHMVLDQVVSESHEVREAIEKKEPPERIREEVGDLLHSVVSLCVFCDYDVDEILTAVTSKFAKRMRLVKEAANARGLSHLHGQSVEFMLELWQEAKDKEG